MNKLTKTLLLLTLIISINCKAQNEKGYFAGLNFGMTIGNITIIEANPTFGKVLTDRLLVGTGFTYIYYGDNNYTPKISTSIYSLSLFTEYLLFKDMNEFFPFFHDTKMFAHVEYKGSILETDYFYHGIDRPSSDKYLYNGYIAGFHLQQPLSQNASLGLLVLVDLNNTINSYEQNPIIRLNFTFGL